VTGAVSITLLTLRVGILSLALGLLPGVGLGWLLARKSFRGKVLVQTLIGLPLVLPPVAVGLLLLLLIGRRGPIGALLHALTGHDLIFTWEAAAIASCAMSFPLLVRSVQHAIAEVPARLEQVAASLGSSGWRVFTTVTLPLARRGLVYGAILAFTRGLGEFGATSIVAGSIPGRTETLSLGIYGRVLEGEEGAALGLAVVSIVLAFGATYLSELYLTAGSRRFGPDPPRGASQERGTAP
jgi:molybdate transport system permease protein